METESSLQLKEGRNDFQKRAAFFRVSMQFHSKTRPGTEILVNLEASNPHNGGRCGLDTSALNSAEHVLSQ
jgi:hypothetical protein